MCETVHKSEHCVVELEHFSSFILPRFPISEDCLLDVGKLVLENVYFGVG